MLKQRLVVTSLGLLFGVVCAAAAHSATSATPPIPSPEQVAGLIGSTQVQDSDGCLPCCATKFTGPGSSDKIIECAQVCDRAIPQPVEPSELQSQYNRAGKDKAEVVYDLSLVFA